MSTQPDKSSRDSQIDFEVEIAQKKMNLIGLKRNLLSAGARTATNQNREILIDFNNFLVVLDYQNDSGVESGENSDPLF
jgi:hypothetical protein